VLILVTGSGGLIGSAAALNWLKKGHQVYGIDNNMRAQFFGPKGDVSEIISRLKSFKNYQHFDYDIRVSYKINDLFEKIKPDVIIHTAAQPSHDKAADIPILDFEVNANGTLNLLEATRKFCSNSAVFIHMSTNKVYGDGPNKVFTHEFEKRYDFIYNPYHGSHIGYAIVDAVTAEGITEKFPIDNCLHSLFGASKLAADVMAQEYGKYFGMNVGIFRGGCLTGPQHAGVELHGFLSYIVKCALDDVPYTIFGYKGKQVRDQIHCNDVISCFDHFIENPKKGEVYNLGGGKENAASVLEVIDLIEELSGKKLNYTQDPENRIGDHICYYTDMSKFQRDYPNWVKKYSLRDIIKEMIKLRREK
jgi:CDP-paratose 2-epimerase